MAKQASTATAAKLARQPNHCCRYPPSTGAQACITVAAIARPAMTWAAAAGPQISRVRARPTTIPAQAPIP